MDDKIIILEATPEDARGITLVRRTTWLTTYPNDKIGITKKDIEEAIKKRTIEEETLRRAYIITNDENSKIWVAKDNEVIVGFVNVQKDIEASRIRAFYILPEYQGKGIGSELMTKALEWLGNENIITCEVAAYNKNAIKFYKKFGFSENGPTHNEASYLPSGKEIPEIEMVKGINS